VGGSSFSCRSHRWDRADLRRGPCRLALDKSGGQIRTKPGTTNPGGEFGDRREWHHFFSRCGNMIGINRGQTGVSPISLSHPKGAVQGRVARFSATTLEGSDNDLPSKSPQGLFHLGSQFWANLRGTCLNQSTSVSRQDQRESRQLLAPKAILIYASNP
jgi:hypothetical protein